MVGRHARHILCQTQVADVSSIADQDAGGIYIEMRSGRVVKYALQNEDDAQLCVCAVRCIQVLINN